MLEQELQFAHVTDSTKSGHLRERVAGQIRGAWRGFETLPHEWVGSLDVLGPALQLVQSVFSQVPQGGPTRP